MIVADIAKDNCRLGPGAVTLGRAALGVGLLGLAGGLVFAYSASGGDHASGAGPAHAGVHGGWALFLRAYLVGFCFVTTISLGGLFFTIVQHATKAGWSVVVRRIAELLAGNLRWLGLAFIPILLGMWWSETTHLYHWNTADGLADPILQGKAAFLNPTFWTIRSALYFLIWGALANFFLRNSTRQDETGDPSLTLRMQKWSYPAAILFAVTITFAGIDWIMSLEPHWFSTMFGVYFFAGSACGFFATLIVLCHLLQRSGRLERAITAEHYQDMGKLLFGIGIVFWAYIGFSQYMLIWYANLPEETPWFLVRQLGDWAAVSILLVVGHFFGPFLAILSRHMKRQRTVIVAAALWMMLMHLVDLYWLIMPQVPAEAVAAAPNYPALAEQFRDLTISLHPAHALFVVAFIALAAAGMLTAMKSRSLVPIKDPRLREALAFENV
jgi:hypothetical protein